MASILKKIGSTTNVPVHTFECDDVADLSKIDVSKSPMGSRCYVINTGTWYALNSKKQWKTVPSGGGDNPGGGGGGDLPEEGEEIVYDGGEES